MVGWRKIERERASTLQFSVRSLRAEGRHTLVTAFLVVTWSHGASGQPREVSVSRCVAGIEWASGTVVS